MQTAKVSINDDDDDDDEFGQGFNPSHCVKSSVTLSWIFYVLSGHWVFSILFPRNVGFLFSSSMPWGGTDT